MKRTVIVVDAELEPLMPAYLRNRKEDLVQIQALLREGDFAQLAKIGHKLRGSGGGYGLDFLSGLGKRMEEACAAGDGAAIEAQAAELREFLETVVIEFSPS